MKLAGTCILLLMHLFTFSQTRPTTINIGIDSLLAAQNLAGAVWAVVDGDRIDYGGTGLKNLGTGEKIDKNDKVHVGSITKTVLALGILRLATENRLHIDDPVRRYLPGLPLNNPWESANPVTVRHLLDHTSGLSDIRLWHFFSDTSTPDAPLSEFYKRSPDVLKINTRPGTVFSYSNMGYTVLGMLIEAVVGESYETYLDRKLLQPLGLENSTFRFVSQNADKRLVMGHFDNGDPAPAMPMYVRPAGQFTTTPSDMGKLLKFILDEGRLNGTGFIRKEFIGKLGIPAKTIASENGLKNGYAFGAVSRDRHRVTGIAHSGNIVGFHAMYYLFPGLRKAFFISHNMDSETADYEVFNHFLIHCLGIPPEPVERDRPYIAGKSKKWDGYYVPLLTRIEPMRLFDIIGSHVWVKAVPEGMSLAPFQKKETMLKWEKDQLFRGEDKTNVSHLFYEGKNGEKYLTTGILTLEKTNGWKIFGIALSFVIGALGCLLLLLSGIYKLAGAGREFFKEPVFWVFAAVFLVVAAGTGVLFNGVIHIGNKNAVTFLLFLATILLPAGSLVSLALYAKRIKYNLMKPGLWITVSVLQLAVLLWCYGVIPFATWR
ncbi:hypothetical protein GCM10023091_21570 [Ravibacter arvi]|uniref:Beta-lactamase-related domain-containing protein n=1 Tax=Ravibacter arvi TaxID=2051041 RepID=A0ABP8LZ17_9BACT